MRCLLRKIHFTAGAQDKQLRASERGLAEVESAMFEVHEYEVWHYSPRVVGPEGRSTPLRERCRLRESFTEPPVSFQVIVKRGVEVGRVLKDEGHVGFCSMNSTTHSHNSLSIFGSGVKWPPNVILVQSKPARVILNRVYVHDADIACERLD